MIKDHIKTFVEGRSVLRFSRLLNRINKNCLRVIAFHHIPRTKHSTFERIIKYIVENYNVLDPRYFTKCWLDGEGIDNLSVMLTFDDGFHSQYIAAEAILDRYNIKGMFFVNPLYINSATRADNITRLNKLFKKPREGYLYDNELLPMREKELIGLQEMGHVIGSHAMSHSNLGTLFKESEIKYEVEYSAELLGQILGTKIYNIAFPFGKLDNINPDVLKKILRNYKYCFSSIPGINKPKRDINLLFRSSISLNHTVEYNCFVIENGLVLKYILQAIKLRQLASMASNLP